MSDRSVGTDVGSGRLRRIWRGRPEDPAWYRPALWALLVATAVAYIWDLGASGWANSFYSAAAQAGSSSWKAFFFGSFDASNAITVDKPPASLWAMGLAARVFGVTSWSILVPQALMGVGSVALVTMSVKRWFRPGAALLAGLVVAATPVAALMFRFNNPDALLVLLLCAAAYAVTRAIESDGGSWRWLALAGTFVGFAFLSKMLQGFVVLPAFALAYFVAAPTTFWRRFRDLAVLGVTSMLAAGWWVAIVELWPADSRPYIGGSQNNSVLELIFGYNGLGRLTGNEVGSVGRTVNNSTGRWGPTGVFRMFNHSFGGQISWLLPAATVLFVVGLLWTLRTPRTDRARAALLLWGGWLFVTGVLFSFGQGIIHEYYSVALAPAIGALIGIGASLAWDRRGSVSARAVMAAVVGLTAVWTAILLGRTTDWHTWLRPTVLVLSAVSMVALLVGDRLRRGALTATVAGAVLAVVAGLAAPVAATATTVAVPHTGAIPTAGPVMAARVGSGRHVGPGAVRGGPSRAGAAANAAPASGGIIGGPAPGGPAPGAPASGGPVTPGQGDPSIGGHPSGPMIGPFPGALGGMGSLLHASKPSAATVAALRKGAGDFDWVLATTGSNNAAGFQLATGEPVMAIGGFNGTDPAPTLEQFQQLVADGRIHFYVSGGFGGQSMGGANVGSEIAAWVHDHFDTAEVGDVTMYDLTSPIAP